LPVSAKVAQLRSGTEYNVQLFVIYKNNLPTGAGYDEVRTFAYSSFTTLPGGGVVLRSSNLKVRRGRVALRMKCAQQQPCHGRFSIAVGNAHTSRARASNARRVACASARYKIAAGKTKTVKAKLSRRCLALLRKARHHTLRATFAVPQLGITQAIRLRL
jgi:hypothetical protein